MRLILLVRPLPASGTGVQGHTRNTPACCRDIPVVRVENGGSHRYPPVIARATLKERLTGTWGNERTGLQQGDVGLEVVR